MKKKKKGYALPSRSDDRFLNLESNVYLMLILYNISTYLQTSFFVFCILCLLGSDQWRNSGPLFEETGSLLQATLFEE